MSEIPPSRTRSCGGGACCARANLTREDAEQFLALAPRVPIRTHVQTWPLAQADEALDAVRTGRVRGAAVLLCQ